MRSLPRAAAAGAAVGGAPEALAPGGGSSLHAATAANTTIDEHSCTVLFMDIPPSLGRRTRLAAPIVEASARQIQTVPARLASRLAAQHRKTCRRSRARARHCTKLALPSPGKRQFRIWRRAAAPDPFGGTVQIAKPGT